MNREFRHSVFPILPLRPQEDAPPRVYCDPGEQGSAFFITKGGLFITARHVVEKWSFDSYAVLAVNHDLKAKKDCRVTALERHPDLDIAIGLAELPGDDGWPQPFALGASRIRDGAAVLLFGYANTQITPATYPQGPTTRDEGLVLNLDPQLYTGKVVEYLPKTARLNGPCYHVSSDPGGGISGGPLIRTRTRSVHGVFSAGMQNESGPAIGFATALSPILNTWRISFIDELTLLEYSRLHPQELRIR